MNKYMNKIPIFWHREFLFSYFFDHSYYLTPCKLQLSSIMICDIWFGGFGGRILEAVEYSLGLFPLGKCESNIAQIQVHKATSNIKQFMGFAKDF